MSVSKRLLATVLVLILATCVASGGFAQGKPTANAPAVVIGNKTANIGDVLEGQDVLYTFKIKNAGKAELQILSVKPG